MSSSFPHIDESGRLKELKKEAPTPFVRILEAEMKKFYFKE
jgi:hypothetical protein